MIELALEPSFDFSSEEFARLYRRGGRTAFQHPIWLSTFYRHLPPASGVEPYIVTGRLSMTGELALLVPLVQRGRDQDTALEFASLGVTDYAAPLATAAAVAGLRGGDALLSFLTKCDAPASLRIEPIREDDSALWRNLLGSTFTPMGFHRHGRPISSPFTMRDVLGAKKARDLDRKWASLSERGDVRFDIVAGRAARRAILEAAQLRTNRFPGDPLANTAFVQFYAEVAELGPAADYSMTCRLSCGEETVAVLFGICWHRSFCYLLLACDYGAYGRHSPGYLMFDRTMSAWAARGGNMFDFTIGDEPYKRDFGVESWPMYRSVVAISS